MKFLETENIIAEVKKKTNQQFLSRMLPIRWRKKK